MNPILVFSLSLSQAEQKWKEFKALRNRVNNRIWQEEIRFKKSKINECQGDPGKVWSLAKKNMDWASPGPPIQLEDEEDKSRYKRVFLPHFDCSCKNDTK